MVALSPLRSFFPRLREHLIALTGWRRDLLAVAAGSASVMAFAPIFIWPLLFLTLPVFLWLIDSSKGCRSAGRAGFFFGFGFFFFSLFWIGEAFLVEAERFAFLLPLAVTLLPAGLALYWAAAAAIARKLWPTGLARIFLFALTLAAAEWLRGHLFTGLPWNLLGYALTFPLPLMQAVSLVGVYGLTAIAALIFTAPLVVLADARDTERRATLIALGVAVVPLVLLYAWGAYRLTTPTSDVAGINLRIVQPSVPQREKWMAEHQRRIFADHLTLSHTDEHGVIDGAANITHIIWPEAAMPFLPLEHNEALTAIADMLPDGAYLATGALRREMIDKSGARLPLDAHRLYNGILVFDTKGALVSTYDKIHLVPFGEYLPADPILTALGLKKLTHGQGAFTPGEAPRKLLPVPGWPSTLGLVCYEALFPGAVVQSGGRPDAILNVTNDGWFGNTSGPRQHFHQTRVRAVEEGVPVIRAANNGISAIIDPYGRAEKILDLNVRGVIDGRLPVAAGATYYSLFGDWILLGIICAYGVITVMLPRR